MGLNRYRIGDLITVVDERNTFGYRNFYGININKEFMPTAADTNGLDESKYKVVRNKRFVFSGMQTGRDECIRLSMFTKDEPVIVSPAYTTFEVTTTEKVLPTYFFIRFLSKEKDRYGSFLSDGSIRSNLDWSVFCDIELELPSIDIQQKYVDVYNAMVANQQCYERGLNDIKVVYDSYIDYLKEKNNFINIGKYIRQTNNVNVDNKRYKFAGLSMENYFIDSIADDTGLDFSKYKIVFPNEYGAVLMKVGRDCRLTIARNTSSEPILISPAYYSFKLDGISPEYFMANVNRSEFERRGWFSCDASARGSLSWSEFLNLKIPNGDEVEQKIVENLYNVQLIRFNLNERLKKQIKDICPILIKGSIEEGKLDKGV